MIARCFKAAGSDRRVDRADVPAFATLREGAPFVGALALGAVPLWRLHPLAGSAALALAAGCAAFFRDPVRSLEAEPDTLFAAADGRVIGIDRVDEPWFLKGRALRISVFLSLFDVHVNRSPATARISDMRDIGGRFAPAMDFQRSHGNRRREIAMVGERGPFVVVQVAGLLARRIVGWAGVGDELRAGQKLGMITFGSRTDLLVPEHRALPLLARGARVRAAETPVARWM
jgi:phosphatidylserine decarboxylase